MLLVARYHPAVFSNVTDVKPVQPSKAYIPMLVTLSGMVIDVKPLQPEKADCPMLITLSGMVMDVKPLQPEKARRSMLAPPVMITSFNEAGT